MESFGEIVRQARGEKNLILRQVGAELDIDQAIISKLERGERKPTKEQVQKFAKFYNLDEDRLLIAWLSDKVMHYLENENLAEEALKMAEQKIRHNKLKTQKS